MTIFCFFLNAPTSIRHIAYALTADGLVAASQRCETRDRLDAEHALRRIILQDERLWYADVQWVSEPAEHPGVIAAMAANEQRWPEAHRVAAAMTEGAAA